LRIDPQGAPLLNVNPTQYKGTFILFFKCIRTLIAILVSTAIFGCVKSSETPAKKKIKLAFVGSLTGETSTFSQSALRGIELALDEAKTRGYEIEWIVKDNGGSPKVAVQNMNELVADPNLLAIFGEISSAMSLTIAPIAQRAGIPLITPASTNPRVTEVGPFVFRISFIDPFQGEAMAQFATEHLHLKSVAILKDSQSDYSRGLADSFKKNLNHRGGHITTEQTYTSGGTDFSVALKNIKATKPQAIYLPGYYREVAFIALQARAMGIEAQLLGGDGWDSENLYADGKAAIVGGYYSNHFTADKTDTPQAQKFIEAYKNEYSILPDGLAARGYDAVNIVLAALEQSSSASRLELRSSLAKTKKFPGVTGLTTLNSQRNAEKPAVILKVSGSNHTYVTTIAP
jgi:branched-chain amino acid transport system substrate-binding protein